MLDGRGLRWKPETDADPITGQRDRQRKRREKNRLSRWYKLCEPKRTTVVVNQGGVGGGAMRLRARRGRMQW